MVGSTPILGGWIPTAALLAGEWPLRRCVDGEQGGGGAVA